MKLEEKITRESPSCKTKQDLSLLSSRTKKLGQLFQNLSFNSAHGHPNMCHH